MYRIIITLSLIATLSNALPTNAVTRMATEAYVTNRVALGVASAVAQAGTNATSGLSSKAEATHTNDATAHPGLFLSVGWQPAWTNIVGLPSTFAPEAHTQGYTTITDAPWITATNKMTTLWATNGNSFVTVDGTNVDVWAISAGVVTNLWITYSEDFQFTLDGITNRPAGPSFFPFGDLDGDWYGKINFGEYSYVVGKTYSWTASIDQIPATLNPGPPSASGYAYINYTNMPVLVTNHVARFASTNDLPTWITLAGRPTVFPPDAHSHSWDTITNPPSSIATALQPADISGFVTSSQIPQYTAQNWLAYSNLTGSVTVTNAYEAPVALVGTGSVSVAFSGLRIPYPVYVTAQGFTSLVFPANTYLVGGGSWQTNRVNHFIVWQYSTHLYVNPVITTEL